MKAALVFGASLLCLTSGTAWGEALGRLDCVVTFRAGMQSEADCTLSDMEGVGRVEIWRGNSTLERDWKDLGCRPQSRFTLPLGAAGPGWHVVWRDCADPESQAGLAHVMSDGRAGLGALPQYSSDDVLAFPPHLVIAGGHEGELVERDLVLFRGVGFPRVFITGAEVSLFGGSLEPIVESVSVGFPGLDFILTPTRFEYLPPSPQWGMGRTQRLRVGFSPLRSGYWNADLLLYHGGLSPAPALRIPIFADIR